MSYDELVREAADTSFTGWDFSALDGRKIEQPPSWNYRDVIRPFVAQAEHMLDMGTGGGEFLASLGRLPAEVTATEGYPPNIPVAKRRLEPLGVTVTAIPQDERAPLPLPDNAFDLIINRHEFYDPAEVRRILRPGGRFVTQQVGGDDIAELNAPPHESSDWNLGTARARLADAGFAIFDSHEEYCGGEFRDIGAVWLYLRLAPWQIPGFRAADYDSQLRTLHEAIVANGPLAIGHHRFLLVVGGLTRTTRGTDPARPAAR